MKMTMTQEDIDRGVPGACYQCPLSRMLQRETGFIWAVTAMKLRKFGQEKYIDVTPQMKAFIQMFDNDLTVEPEEFDIPVELFLEGKK